jgi:K+-transporting ATPase ATPase C chain
VRAAGSGSGLDPHISPANALLQAQRVADARKLPKAKVLELVQANTDRPDLGFLGDPGVNVLMLNIALEKLAPPAAPAAVPAGASSTAPGTK